MNSIPAHRVRPLRLILAMIVIFSVFETRLPWFAFVVCVYAAFGLFLLSPLADKVERRER